MKRYVVGVGTAVITSLTSQYLIASFIRWDLTWITLVPTWSNDVRGFMLVTIGFCTGCSAGFTALMMHGDH